LTSIPALSSLPLLRLQLLISPSQYEQLSAIPASHEALRIGEAAACLPSSMKDDSEQVLESIMEDGTFDELRKKIVDRVKQDVCL